MIQERIWFINTSHFRLLKVDQVTKIKNKLTKNELEESKTLNNMPKIILLKRKDKVSFG